MKKLAIALALGLASLGAQAQTTTVETAPAKSLYFVVGAGLTFGGDKLATAEFENGGEINIHAGSMIALLAGLEYRVSPEFSVQGTVGYHVDNASASNGDIRFERVPVELLAYYHVNEQVRVGGGLRYVTNTALRSSGAGDIGDYDFKNTTSPVAEIEYLVSPQVGIKLRYVNDKFEEKQFGGKVKGDHVGILANFYF
ncbi:porin family protein [Massilia sp. Dwa41.01b]|uniref:outer membrane beta-barrel protein n=1 Tax=unclassified Massilia TaxID=2609279 RepID=UPI001601D4FE|nr:MULTISPECIES: outer membrane beta-barrel protein [unclassified Massilia]QNA89181.1 porin family protein [Massilia sp. Dwa41.01b]QNB00080.1 porin family protein [Massilia sp. Se16.2.3]